jgi:hypothetical protein
MNYAVTCMQSLWRRHLVKMFLSTLGPAMVQRDLCNNPEDFLTADPMNDIDVYSFVSIQDEGDQFVYGFHITSLQKMLDHHEHTMFKTKRSHPLENPYTRKAFTDSTVDLIRRRTRYNNILMPTTITDPTFSSLEPPSSDPPDILVTREVIALFQHIDLLGNYTRHEWLLDLHPHQLHAFLIHLHDIWYYRASLPASTRVAICPPHGNPFHPFNLSNQHVNINLQQMSLTDIRQVTCAILKRVTQSSNSLDMQTLGSMYALIALTLVSNDAAVALPWLYQSVQ